MGGTDRMNQDAIYYRILIQIKKWCWPIFSWILDVSIQNAWRLHCSSDQSMSLLDFRCHIARTYFNRYRPTSFEEPGCHWKFFLILCLIMKNIMWKNLEGKPGSVLLKVASHARLKDVRNASLFCVRNILLLTTVFNMFIYFISEIYSEGHIYFNIELL